ncbi:glycoside hydrolase family 18 protein, partial [Francisella sciaenopsi]|uniref:glycoside hydrolase family 18 protein n=1 Tax=Francisella sciaenopsi TaxID=3055034 RepID=UPI0038B294AC
LTGYKISTSPSSFTTNQDTQSISVTIAENSSDTNWPDRAVVGYVRGYDAEWYSQPETTNEMIQAAMTHGYNVIVYAFAGQDSDGTVTLPKWTDEMKSRIPAQLNIIHNNGGIALLSIGGAENYFDPDMSGDNATTTGQAMGKFLADNGYDGLDVDVEHPNASTSEATNFIKYLDAARTEFKSITDKDMYLAAAPQVNGWYGTGQWASGSAKFAEAMYTQDFMNEAKFNAVFIQTYNQYGGANFGGLKGFDVGFLSMTFDLLSPETRADMTGLTADSFYVPEGTKIILGVPDFRDPSVSDSEYQQGSCLADAKCSGAGLYDPVDISKDITNGGLGNYSQYGGLMTWILNSDSYQGWTWVDGVKGVAYN